MSNLGTLLT